MKNLNFKMPINFCDDCHRECLEKVCLKKNHNCGGSRLWNFHSHIAIGSYGNENEKKIVKMLGKRYVYMYVCLFGTGTEKMVWTYNMMSCIFIKFGVIIHLMFFEKMCLCFTDGRTDGRTDGLAYDGLAPSPIKALALLTQSSRGRKFSRCINIESSLLYMYEMIFQNIPVSLFQINNKIICYSSQVVRNLIGWKLWSLAVKAWELFF